MQVVHSVQDSPTLTKDIFSQLLSHTISGHKHKLLLPVDLEHGEEKR